MLSKTTNIDRKDDTPLFRKIPLTKFPSLEMTHNHNTLANALISGGCVISRKINLDTFFLNKSVLSHSLQNISTVCSSFTY